MIPPSLEEQTRRLTERFQDLMESVPDAMIIVNREGLIVKVNQMAEQMFGYSREEMLGKPIEFLIPDRFRSGHVAQRTQYAREPRKRPMGVGLDLYGLRKGGIEFQVEISLSPLKLEEGTFFMSAIRDITERKRHEGMVRQALQEANRLKSEFLANMSHELRTPMNGIIGFSEFLIDGKAGALNDRQKEHLNDILNSGRHLLRIINDVLDLAKVEAGKVEVHPEPCSLSALVDEVTAGVARFAEEEGVTLKKSLSLGRDEAVLDLQKLRQILYNLLSNAIKFTPKGGSVTLTAARAGGRLAFSVADTGIGIKKEDQARLFREFEQVDSGLARRYEGTGLGLALVKKLIELQGGRIEVESEPGKGSIFTIIYPSEMS